MAYTTAKNRGSIEAALFSLWTGKIGDVVDYLELLNRMMEVMAR